VFGDSAAGEQPKARVIQSSAESTLLQQALHNIWWA